MIEGHLHHGHGPLDDLRAGSDDRGCLLPLKHRRCDFRSIGKVADAGLDHLDAGLIEPLLDVGPQLLADLLGIAAERHLVILAVVGIAHRKRPQRRLALHGDEVFVVLDMERRLGRVHDAPHHHGRDLDRVAVEVVDLRRPAMCSPLLFNDLPRGILLLGRPRRAGLEITDPQRDRALGVEGIGPEKSGLADRPHIFPEEGADAGLVGANGHQAAKDQDPGEDCRHNEKRDQQRHAGEDQRRNDHRR